MKELLAKENQKQAILKMSGYDIPRSRDFILAKARLKPGSLLEIGTGKGHFTVSLAKTGFSLISIDLDPLAQKLAREYLRRIRLGRKVRLAVMNAGKLKFAAHSFDNVISVNFMHHAKQPVRCLREMVRVAKTKIVIADINKKGEIILGHFHKQRGRRHPRSRTSFENMRTFLKKKGFAVKMYKGFCQTIIVADKADLPPRCFKMNADSAKTKGV